MKLALRYIPAEVWVDVFIYPWIKRKKLGKIVHKFKNRKFIEILQYCLHERGKRTLKKLSLNKKILTKITRAPLPENIKFFRQIEIWYFDARTLDFLRQISTLFTGVNLNLMCFGRSDLDKLRPILDRLAPLILGLHSLSFQQSALPLMEQHFAQKLAPAKMLTISFDYYHRERIEIEAFINFSLDWLLGERAFPEPKFLLVVHWLTWC